MKSIGKAAADAAALGVFIWGVSTGVIAAPDGIETTTTGATSATAITTLPEVRIESSRTS